MKVKSESEVAQLCLTLCDPMDCSLPGSSIRGIFQARVLEWGAIAFSVYKASESEITQLRPTLFDLMDCSLPGSSIHGIFQAKLLEWVAVSFCNRILLSHKTEKAMAPHSSTLAWKIPWMEEPGRLQSMGSLRVGYD